MNDRNQGRLLLLLAGIGAASLIAFALFRAATTSGTQLAISDTIPAFTADVVLTEGATTEYGQLIWHDYRNWRFDIFDSVDRSKVRR